MNRLSILGASALAALAMAAASVPAAAQTTTFNFKGGNSSTVGAAGNTRTFTNNNGTITVEVSAWSLDTANGTPVAAYLGYYDLGLGVTNSISGNARDGYTTGDNSHTIDNVGRFDFVSLKFSTAVQLLYGTLTPFDVTNDGITNYDNDPSVSFTIDKFNAGILDPVRMADLQLHTTELQGKTTGNFSTNLNPGMNTGNIWTIGADRLFAINTDLDDGFKLSGISVQIPTPEPSSWAMMIGGFGVVGGTMRRRRSAQTKLSIA